MSARDWWSGAIEPYRILIGSQSSVEVRFPMKKMPALVAALTLMLGLGACAPSLPGPLGPVRFQSQRGGQSFLPLNPQLPKGRETRPATVLSYLPIDDGLQEHIGFYLNTLERTT